MKTINRTILTSTITGVSVEADGKTEKHLDPITVNEECNKGAALKALKEAYPTEKVIKVKEIAMSETVYSLSVDAFMKAATKGESTPAGKTTF